MNSSNQNKTFQSFALALSKPLEFAARNNFAHLNRVKDLEKSFLEAIEQFPKEQFNEDELSLVDQLIQLSPREEAEQEERIKAIEQCLVLLKKTQPKAEPTSDLLKRLQPFSKEEIAAVEKLSLDSPLQYIKGVGPKLAEKFSARGLHTVEQLLRFLPRRYEIRRMTSGIGHLQVGQGTTIRGEILTKSFRRFGRRSTLEVAVGDETGVVRLKWFRVPGKAYAEKFQKGLRVQASGQVTTYKQQMQIVHPETLFLEAGAEEEQLKDEIIPLYPEIEGIRPAHLRKVIQRVLPTLNKMSEILPPHLLEKEELPHIGQALHFLHHPPIAIDDRALEYMDTPWHRRLIYEELLFLQLAVLERKGSAPKSHSFPLKDLPSLQETAKFRGMLGGGRPRRLRPAGRACGQRNTRQDPNCTKSDLM